MNKYHVNDKGEAGACRATKACRFGNDSDHHESAEEARASYEKRMGGSFDVHLKPWETDDREVVKANGGRWQPQLRTWRFSNQAAYDQARAALKERKESVGQAKEARSAERDQLLATRPSISIPFEASQVRQKVKEMGARWNPDLKQWAVPEDKAEEARALVVEWEAAQPKKAPRPRCICEEMDEAHCPIHSRGQRITALAQWGDQYAGGE